MLLDAPRRLVLHVRSTPPRFQTRREEFANALTHGVGLVASLVAGPFLVAKAASSGDRVMVAACVAYVIPLAAVFFCSTMSHAVAEPRRKIYWEGWDQATIYLLITGSYTPYATAYLRSDPWPILTGTMWVLAAVGFLSKLLLHHRLRKAIVALYVALGWLPTISLPWLVPQMHPTCFLLTLGGGLCYTFGTAFLMYDRVAPFLHVLWHLAVLAGAALQFAAIWLYVVR